MVLHNLLYTIPLGISFCCVISLYYLLFVNNDDDMDETYRQNMISINLFLLIASIIIMFCYY